MVYGVALAVFGSLGILSGGWLSAFLLRRGYRDAMYLVVVNLIGLRAGPTAVALLTDHLFHDDNMLRHSLAIV
jgi:hypothetical protein